MFSQSELNRNIGQGNLRSCCQKSKSNKSCSKILFFFLFQKFFLRSSTKFCHKNILSQRQKVFKVRNEKFLIQNAQIVKHSSFFDVFLTIYLNVFLIIYLIFVKMLKLLNLHDILYKFLCYIFYSAFFNLDLLD